VLPLECVLHAVKTLLALPVGKSNEPNSLLSLCVTLGIQARSISKNRGKSPLVCGILAHQFEKHQYRMHLPVNTRIDLLTPTRHARAAEEVRVVEKSHHSVEVQTDTAVPRLSKSVVEIVNIDGWLTTDATTQTDSVTRSSTAATRNNHSTRNNHFLLPTPLPVTPTLKRTSTTSQYPPAKIHKTNPAEETKDQEESNTVQKRKRKSLGHRNKAKTRSAHPSEMERGETSHRKQLKEKGILAVRALEALVLGMPWSNEVDSDGKVVRLGKKDLALYVAVESIAEGCELETSCSLGTRLFDVPADTIRKAWYAFMKNDYAFVTSLRGKHPKLQWTLQDCGVKVRHCRSNDCMQ
jgi:hypothetical protein